MEAALSFEERVKTEVDLLKSPKSNPVRNILTLVITLVAFASLGLFHSSLEGLLMIVVVLLVHEAGHLVGMKLYGYRDVRMFFIPFLGAAVSGTDHEPRSARQAVVLLLGPVPGIIIGVVLGVMSFKNGNELYRMGANTFLFINGFNLLPFFPLDGGRLFNSLFFSRGARAELVFKTVTALALGVVAIYLQAYLLGVLALFLLLGLRNSHVVAQVAQEVRAEKTSDDSPGEDLSEEFVSRVTPKLTARLSVKTDDPKYIATVVHDVWQRVRNVRASVGATLGLLLVYLATGSVALIAPYAFQAIDIYAGIESVVEVRPDAEGNEVSWLVKYSGEQKTSEVPLDQDGLYHGVQLNWELGTGQLDTKGPWEHGYWQGSWDFYKDGVVFSVIEYDKGVPQKYAEKKDGSLRWIPRDDWPFHVKAGAQTEVGRAW